MNGDFERINPLQDASWDDRLKACPSASFFHSAAWARVLQSAYGFTPVYFIRSKGGRLLSLLPIMEVDSGLTGRRGVSLPFTDHLEPVGLDPVSYREVFKEAVEYGKKRKWRYFECRGGKPLLPGAPVATSFFGHRLDLERTEEILFGGLENSVQRAIRKAERAGLDVEISRSPDAIHVFHRLFCLTRQRHGLPPQPLRFFQSLQDHVLSRNQGMVVLARYHLKPVAAALFVHFSREAIYKFGASDKTFQHFRGNNLVMWEAIKWHAKNNFRQLHFGRTSAHNKGLRQFKLGWGTEEHPIEYFRYDLRQNNFVTAKDRVSGWYNRFFQIMPNPASRFIGEILYRHMA